MKITVEKNILLNAIIPASGFASGRNTIAATEGILLRTVSEMEVDICAYDLEKGIKTTVGCIVSEPGCNIINAARFIQIVRTMPEGNITVEVDPKTLRAAITGKKSRFELQALDGKDFPDFPELRGDRGFTMKQCNLKKIIAKTQFAIAVNNTRPELNGLSLSVHNGELTAVSCDGSRLAVYSEKGKIENVGVAELDFSIIIPGKTVAELTRFIEDSEKTLKINVARKHVIFFIDNFILFTRLIDAQYVDYNRFIPKQPKIFVTVDREELTSALERAMLVTEERQQGQLKSPVICNIDGGVLTVSSSSITGRVNDEITVRHEGEAVEIGFNCRYLFDAMKACDGDEVRISLTSPLMGITIEPAVGDENRKFLLLVLPIRLNK